jgi:hypothetical protein
MPSPAFQPSDGPSIQQSGIAAKKNQPIVFFSKQSAAFTVTGTNGAIQQGLAGDYIAYSPATGAIFLVTAAVYASSWTAVPPIVAPAPSPAT